MARRNRENDYERTGTEDQQSQDVGDRTDDTKTDETILETESGPQESAGANGGATTKKGKSDEQKSADFKRLASNRASNAFDAMTALSHLANTTQYAWSEQQENTMFDALEDRVKMLRASFKAAREAAANRAPGERGKRTKAHSVIV